MEEWESEGRAKGELVAGAGAEGVGCAGAGVTRKGPVIGARGGAGAAIKVDGATAAGADPFDAGSSSRTGRFNRAVLEEKKRTGRIQKWDMTCDVGSQLEPAGEELSRDGNMAE